jgi:two-component system sensor kinase FixL
VLEKATEGDGRYEAAYRVVLPSGEVRWLGSRSRVEFDGAGKPILIRGISHDITERKEAEEETQTLRREIAHAGRISMMGQLASALAHEINQPLGAILRNAEAAELFLQNASPDLEEIRAILADIRKDDERAGSVIDRMRGLLKRQTLDRRPVDVSELIGEVAALVRSDAAARHVKLELIVADHLPPVYGDLVHLQQVLLNLIVNGMDALDGANVKERRVRVTASLDGSQAVAIAVSDSGHGIPADTFTHIFDPFFTTKPKGMGMGLPICRTIIEAHKGRLWAENQGGGGAAFRFTLPVTGVGARK